MAFLKSRPPGLYSRGFDTPSNVTVGACFLSPEIDLDPIQNAGPHRVRPRYRVWSNPKLEEFSIVYGCNEIYLVTRWRMLSGAAIIEPINWINEINWTDHQNQMPFLSETRAGASGGACVPLFYGLVGQCPNTWFELRGTCPNRWKKQETFERNIFRLFLKQCYRCNSPSKLA